jgi:hypothetical protein
MAEEKNNENPTRSPEAPANSAENSARRSFMKNVVMAGAVATTGIAAIATAPTAHAAGTCGPIPPEYVKELTGIISSYGKLIDWMCFGQPDPNAVFGTAQIRPEAAGALIQALVKFDKIRLNCEVFPRGIPWPDLVDVKFKTPGVSY